MCFILHTGEQQQPVSQRLLAAFSPDPKGQRWNTGRQVRRSRGVVVRELAMPVSNLAEKPENLRLKLNCSKEQH